MQSLAVVLIAADESALVRRTDVGSMATPDARLPVTAQELMGGQCLRKIAGCSHLVDCQIQTLAAQWM